MRIGICASDVDHILMAYEAGYDFVEVNNTSAVMDDARYPALLELKNSLPEGFMYSCNVLLPSTMRVTGPDVDLDAVRAFCEKSFARLDSLGVKMIVFGSSAAKKVPEGFSMETAMDQLVDAVRMFSEIAAKYSQRVCIEPLRYSECNIINTAEESIELTRRTDRANVGAHVDYFHLMQNGEKLAKLTEMAPLIIHTHIASPCLRSMPTYDDGADYTFFFEALRRGGYSDTVAFEGTAEWDANVLSTTCEYIRSVSSEN